VTNIKRRQDALEWFGIDVSHRFRNRTAFATCRGTVARSKISAISEAKSEREDLQMACIALRTMREALAMHKRHAKRNQEASVRRANTGVVSMNELARLVREARLQLPPRT
jgi:hypothetical protein